jgi:hypothetical protein
VVTTPAGRDLPGLDWRLDTASRELLRNGLRIRLAEKPFKVLEAPCARHVPRPARDVKPGSWTAASSVDAEGIAGGQRTRNSVS